MALRRTKTLSFYNELVELFSKYPDDINRVSKTIGCAYMTAKKVWEEGVSGVGGPIKDVVFGLQAPVRGLLAQHAEAEAIVIGTVAEGLFARMEREAEEAEDADFYSNKMIEAEHTAKKRVEQLLRDAKVDAAETMAKEANLSRSARACAESIYELAERIFTSANVQTLAQFVISALSGGELKPSEAAKFLQTLASFGKEANTVAKLALELERLRVGKPTEIVKVEIENLNEADALAIVEDAAAAAALLRDGESAEEKKPTIEELN